MSGALSLPIERLWDGTPGRDDERVHVIVRRMANGDLSLSIDAPLHGDPPPEAPPGPTWELWNHEVVELFLLGDGQAYTEIEVGPHGHHLVLTLQGHRHIVDRLLPLDVSVERVGDRWTAEARIARSLVPAGRLRGNAYAIHGAGEARRYLAWSPVPGDGPDFHRIELFPPLVL